MISVNLTLLIQGINFIIAYILLKKFFLHPALNFIKQNQAKIDDAEKNLNLEVFVLNQKQALRIEKDLEYKAIYGHELEFLVDDNIAKENFSDLNISNNINLDKDEVASIVKSLSSKLEDSFR